MKKILLVGMIIIMLTGCFNKNNEVDDKVNNEEIEDKPEVVENEYIDNNPIKLGFYLFTNSNTNRKLIDNYVRVWESDIDIGSFEVFFTNENEIDGNLFVNTWNHYYQLYNNDLSNYKIGYHIYFTMNDGIVVDTNILNPVDAENLYNYVQVYLYDDIHQEVGAWYSHVTPLEYNDNTLLTSIKLTNSNLTPQINSDIILTVFTYDEDDFDENGYYRGNSSYSITIKRQ